MQTILDANVHLDGAVRLGGYAVRVHPQIFFPRNILHAPGHSDAYEVTELHIDAVVRLVLLLDVLKVEIECLGVLQLAGCRKLLAEGEELVVVSPVEEHLCDGHDCQ